MEQQKHSRYTFVTPGRLCDLNNLTLPSCSYIQYIVLSGTSECSSNLYFISIMEKRFNEIISPIWKAVELLTVETVD